MHAEMSQHALEAPHLSLSLSTFSSSSETFRQSHRALDQLAHAARHPYMDWKSPQEFEDRIAQAAVLLLRRD